jgi:hypothetical protein
MATLVGKIEADRDVVCRGCPQILLRRHPRRLGLLCLFVSFLCVTIYIPNRPQLLSLVSVVDKGFDLVQPVFLDDST